MTQFGGGVVNALEQMSVGHYATADAGAERKQDEIVDPIAWTKKKFTQRGGVGVVLNFDIHSQERLEAIAQRESRDMRQVWRIPDHAGFGIDQTGTANPGAN